MARKRRDRPVIGTANAKEPSQLVPDSNLNTRTPKIQFTKLCSLSLNTVVLYDWWLVKVEEREGLAVGGFASRDLGVRSFCSAAIAKRHDTTILETVDGITIRISGFINRSRTHLNGFPLKVCNHFLLGFPYYWEDYATKNCGQEYPDRSIPTTFSSFVQVNMASDNCNNAIKPVSLDDIPVTKIRDLLLSPQGDSGDDALERKIFSEVLRKFSCNISAYETSSNPKKAKAGRQYKDHNGIFDAREIKTEEFLSSCLSGIEIDVLSPSKGVTTRSRSAVVNADVRSPTRTANSVQGETPSNPKKNKVKLRYEDDDDDSLFKKSADCITPSRLVTRSMTRLRTLGNKREGHLSSQSYVRYNSSASILTSKATGSQSAQMVTRSGSRGSAVRRSNRLKNRKEIHPNDEII